MNRNKPDVPDYEFEEDSGRNVEPYFNWVLA
jgi:hypothetical protein